MPRLAPRPASCPLASAAVTSAPGINNQALATGFLFNRRPHQHGFLFNTATEQFTLIADPVDRTQPPSDHNFQESMTMALPWVIGRTTQT
jgi:hypothetical protein